MSALIQCEAIVLQSLAFKEYDRILTLFSPRGLFKLFAKGRKRTYFHFAALTSPLTHAEFHYSAGRKDLHRLHEGSMINQNMGLRKRYETLQAAEKMVAALLKSQWIGKPAPHLFHLFRLILEYLPHAHHLEPLITAFLLKILAHEGLLQLSSQPEPTYRYAGERYMSHEAPPGALLVSAEEERWVTQLTQCRSLIELSQFQLTPHFQNKIDTLFQQTFN